VDADSSPEHMLLVATQQELRAEITRGRSNARSGAWIASIGAAMAIAVAVAWGSLLATLVGGGMGLIMVPFGLAVIGRGARQIVCAQKKLRALEPKLPMARLLR
jgi:predicted phage tail protein